MKTKDFLIYGLAVVINLMFFAILIIMIYNQAYESAMLNTMVGTLGTITVMVDSYFFGSSKSSSDKNDIIENLKTK